MSTTSLLKGNLSRRKAFEGTLRFTAEAAQREEPCIKKKRFPLRPSVSCPHFLQLNTSLFSVCSEMTTLPLFSPWTVVSSPYLAVVLTQAIIYAVYVLKLLYRHTLLATTGCFGKPVANNVKWRKKVREEQKKNPWTMALYFQMCD